MGWIPDGHAQVPNAFAPSIITLTPVAHLPCTSFTTIKLRFRFCIHARSALQLCHHVLSCVSIVWQSSAIPWLHGAAAQVDPQATANLELPSPE